MKRRTMTMIACYRTVITPPGFRLVAFLLIVLRTVAYVVGVIDGFADECQLSR